jgi:hypothetical protein
MVAEELAFDHGPVVGAAVGIVGEDHDSVAGRGAADDEVAGIVVLSPLPPVPWWAELDPPAGAPGQLVVYAPYGLPPLVIDSKDVGEEPSPNGLGRTRPRDGRAIDPPASKALRRCPWPYVPDWRSAGPKG